MPATLLFFLPYVLVFVLVLFRVAAMMLSAPVFGSTRVPRRVRILLALVISAGITPIVPPVGMPGSVGDAVVGIAAEIAVGAIMGLILSLVFIAAQWGGEMLGQQIGFNIASVLDPQFGGGGSVVGELYFAFAIMIFLLIGGHRAMAESVIHSFTAIPPMGLTLDRPLFDLFLGALTTSTMLAVRLAAPVFIAMLLSDVALGFLTRTLPQLNVMTAGLSLRSLLGLLILISSVYLTAEVLESGHLGALDTFQLKWSAPSR